jgi:hypothetical protein
MTNRDEQAHNPPHEERSSEEQDAMRALLKRSLGADAPEAETPDVLRGVQRKIRQRSKGKFFGDGWSTAQTRVSYVLVAAAMLVLVAVVYFALGPMGIR